MSSPRETAIEALLTLVAGAYPWASTPSRRLKLWGDVPPSARPACFLFEGGQEAYDWQRSTDPKRTLEGRLFIYTNAKEQSTIGSSQLNEIMDALDTALAPSPGQPMQNLGGAAYWARIGGAPFKDPGDLDGDGLLIVPIKITLP